MGIAAMAVFPPAWVQNESALCWGSLFVGVRVGAEVVEEVMLDIVLGEAGVLEELVLAEPVLEELVLEEPVLEELMLMAVVPLLAGVVGCDVCVVAATGLGLCALTLEGVIVGTAV
jgi:hypothetical protein